MSKNKKKAAYKKPAPSASLGDSCSPFLEAIEHGSDNPVVQETSQRGAVARSAEGASEQMAVSQVAAGKGNSASPPISAFFHLPVRDLFALMIVSGLVGNSQMVYTDKVYAARAYLLADAMLERKKEDE